MNDGFTTTQRQVLDLFLRSNRNQSSPPHADLCVKGKSGEWHRFADRGNTVVSSTVGGPGEDGFAAELDRLDAANDHAGIVFAEQESAEVSILEEG